MKEPAHRIVCRYARVTRYRVAGVEAHGKRRGAVPNVDRSRTHLNTYLVGDENLGDLVNARILEMQKDNAACKIASLKKARRTSQRKALEAAVAEAGDDRNALADIIGWPWDKKNTQPFTEGILLISHE